MKQQSYLDFVRSIIPSEEEFLLFKNSYKSRVAKSIKFINSRVNRKQLQSFLISNGWKFFYPEFLNNSKYSDVICVDNTDSQTLGTHLFHSSGLFYIQEISAGLSAQVLDVRKGDLVLDLCAAPGGKTVQLADRLLSLGGGHVFANEPSNARRKALIFNLNRCGLYNTSILGYDGISVGDLAPEMFDKVLVDAPCSGEGMQYKYDKNVTYWDQIGAEKLSRLQRKLFISGLKSLKVGGELVYSTCTLNPYENEGVIASVLEMFPGDIELLNVDVEGKSFGLNDFLSGDNQKKVARFWPHIQKTGGFFISKFRKLRSIPNDKHIDARVLKKSEYDQSESLQVKIWDYLIKEWGVERNNSYSFFSSKDFVYVKDISNIVNGGLFVEKAGIPICKLGFKGDFIPQQGLVAVFGNYIKNSVVELSYNQLQKISEGSDIPGCYGDEGKFIVIKWNGLGLFLAKQVRNSLKLKI